MQETPASLEGDLRGRLVKQMRERGTEDPEAIRLMVEWAIEKEKEVPTSQPERNRAAALLNVERARLYRDAGCLAEAIENYQDALMQLGDDLNRQFTADIVEIVYSEMEELPQG